MWKSKRDRTVCWRQLSALIRSSDAVLKSCCSTISLCHVLATSEWNFFEQVGFPWRGKATLPGYASSQSEFLYIIFTGESFVLLVTLLCWPSCWYYTFLTSPPLSPTLFTCSVYQAATDCPLSDTVPWLRSSFSLT